MIQKSSEEMKTPTHSELSSMINKGFGTLLTAEEVKRRKKIGDLPADFEVAQGFGVYRIDLGKNEYLCVTNLICEKCQRINGKLKKCEKHKKKKTKIESDQEPTNQLRHIDEEEGDEDEEDKIDGALTPETVLSIGVGGIIIALIVDAQKNKRAGPVAKHLNHVKGILVRGPNGIPQFLPNDRLTRTHKLRFDNYVEGEIIKKDGKSIFVPENMGAAKMTEHNMLTIAKQSIADKIDKILTESIGNKDFVVPVHVDFADNGMPIMRACREVPKEKRTAIGIILNVNNELQFLQIGGLEIGADASQTQLLATTPTDEAKPGDVIALVVINSDGKAEAQKPGGSSSSSKSSVGDKKATVYGKIVLGKNHELVFVGNDDTVDAACRKAQLAMSQTVEENLQKAQVAAQAKITGEATKHVENEIAKIGANSTNSNEHSPPINDVDNQFDENDVRSYRFGDFQDDEQSILNKGKRKVRYKGKKCGYDYGRNGEIKSIRIGQEEKSVQINSYPKSIDKSIDKNQRKPDGGTADNSKKPLKTESAERKGGGVEARNQLKKSSATSGIGSSARRDKSMMKMCETGKKVESVEQKSVFLGVQQCGGAGGGGGGASSMAQRATSSKAKNTGIQRLPQREIRSSFVKKS